MSEHTLPQSRNDEAYARAVAALHMMAAGNSAALVLARQKFADEAEFAAALLSHIEPHEQKPYCRWLIEMDRGGANYVADYHPSTGIEWTAEADTAMKLFSREDAETFIRLFKPGIGARAAEHMFNCGITPLHDIPSETEYPEGCTPADAMLLRTANHDLAADNQRLREALRFYGNKDHFQLADPSAWDTVSGEPQNYHCDEAGTATVEDGTIARLALTGDEIHWDEGPPDPVQGEPETEIEREAANG